MVIRELNLTQFMVEYSNFIYYFSSEFNKTRFKRKLNEYLHHRQKMIETQYDLEVSLDDFFAIKLYKNIEKRGFFIYSLQDKQYINSSDKLYLQGKIITKE